MLAAVALAGGTGCGTVGTRMVQSGYLPVPQPSRNTPKMADSRMAATATLLKNGEVLITGGVDVGSPAVETAEVFDPATGRFTPTGSMTTTRAYHTATLLPDGKVLIAGGLSRAGKPLRTAELYDPSSGKFVPTGKMSTCRYMQTATLLQNGKVLITGGISTPSGVAMAPYQGTMVKMNVVDTAELYDPATGKFTPTGNRTRLLNVDTMKISYDYEMTAGRANQTATLLTSGALAGHVLIAGGMNSDSASLATAELYDPAEGRFTATGRMTTARREQTATPLRNGEVLIAGGAGTKDKVLGSAELYDPATRSFTATGAMSQGRYEQAATLLKNGKVLIAGGGNGKGHILKTAELYDPSSGKFVPTGRMLFYRSMPIATLLENGEVLIAGGFNFSPSVSPGAGLGLGGPVMSFRVLNTAELYDPSSGSFSPPGTGVPASAQR